MSIAKAAAGIDAYNNHWLQGLTTYSTDSAGGFVAFQQPSGLAGGIWHTPDMGTPWTPTVTMEALGAQGALAIAGTGAGTAGNDDAVAINGFALGYYAAWKTTDTSRASNTTKTADPDLSLIGSNALSPNAVYRIEMELQLTDGGGHFAWTFLFPAGAEGTYGAVFYSNSGVLQDLQASGWSDVNTAGPGSGTQTLFLKGLLITHASGGNFTLSWAQAVSNATATKVQKYSFLKVDRLQ